MRKRKSRKGKEVDFLLSGTEESSSPFDTVSTESSVSRAEQPSEEFADKLYQAVQERFMSPEVQAKVREEIIARARVIVHRAVTDADFRKRFFEDMVTACQSIGIHLTQREIDFLQNLKEDALKEFAESLSKGVLDNIQS